MPLTDAELDALDGDSEVNAPSLDRLIAQAREANALRARVEELELMLHTAGDGFMWREGPIGKQPYERKWRISRRARGALVLDPAEDGLPILTDEARAALRGGK